MPSPTRAKNKPIYMVGIFREAPTRILVKFPNARKFQSKFTKVVTLLKIPAGQNPTVPVVAAKRLDNRCKKILVHGPGNSTKYCKVLKKYYEK